MFNFLTKCNEMSVLIVLDFNSAQVTSSNTYLRLSKDFCSIVFILNINQRPSYAFFTIIGISEINMNF